jgi:apolipoprotein N-acyltransferase
MSDSDRDETAPEEPKVEAPAPEAEPKKKRKKKPETSADAGPSEKDADAAKASTAGATSRFPLPARTAYGLALLSGFLYFLGFPGVDVWPISLVALVPLILAMKGQTPRRAAGLGWMAGFTMTMTGFYWLLEMLRVFSGFPTALCLVFMAILCAYQGGRIALAGYLYGRAARKGWPAWLVFALAFASSELLYPLLFPWYFGASVHNFLPLLQGAELGGPIFVGLVLVAGNLAIAELVLARLEARAVDKRFAAIAAVVPVVAAIYGAVRIAMTRSRMAAAEVIKIGIVQGNQPLLGRNHALQVHLNRTRELKEKGVQLVVWSEGAVPRAYPEETYKDAVQKDLTRVLGVPTVVGTILAKGRGEDAKFFNTALLAGDGGKILGRYDKEYLLMFGEYLPFGETFPILYKWSPNSGRFSMGTSEASMPWGDHKISALICYEDILPSFVNKVVKTGDPDLLVNLTNDAWFGNSTEPLIHFALAKMRAVEHRRYLVRSTNSGLSGIIDPLGGVAVHGGTFTEEAIIGEARFMRSTTVYEILGDVPWYLASIVVIAMGFVERKKRAA